MEELASATGNRDVMYAVCDVTNQEQVDAMMAAVDARHGRLGTLAVTATKQQSKPLQGKVVRIAQVD